MDLHSTTAQHGWGGGRGVEAYEHVRSIERLQNSVRSLFFDPGKRAILTKGTMDGYISREHLPANSRN